MIARYVLVRRDVVETVTERTLDTELRIELEAALAEGTPQAVSPPWLKVRAMAGQLSALIADRGPIAVAELDQLRAVMRDELDLLEVSLRDEWALYHGLVWVGMVTELARNGYKNGRLGEDALDAIKEITTTIASALLEFLPPDARA